MAVSNMKRVLSILFLLIFSSVTVTPQQNQLYRNNPGRFEKIINSNWTFNYFPVKNAKEGFEKTGYDDSEWRAISIPHTWSTFETTGETHPFIRNASEKDDPYWWNGWGWYRKHFIINSCSDYERVFVEFEGVQKYCRVWINGNYLGDHKGGYGSFDFDITPFVKAGEDNLLAVAVSNRMNDEYSIPPMSAGNFDVYGGIYRDVTLVLKNNLYIPMQGSASHEGGTFITTPALTEKSGVVRVQTWVKNENKSSRKCQLKTSVIDASGKVIAVMTAKKEVAAGELYRFDQTSRPVKNPRLWSHDDPYLYKVYSELTEGGKVTDTYSSPLGFRWFHWDYEEDFLYLNGEKMVIHGGNRHQEYPWVGDALPKWITEMDYYDMAVNMNYNFMRTAHYPNDRLVYELADKYGIVIDEESPSIKNQLFSAEVQEQQMKEMIRRDRNHPSIIFWSMGNETNHAVDSKYAIAEDTTRILTARRVSDGSAGTYVTHTDNNLALENLLRCTIRGWYNKDVKDLEPSDSQHSGTEEHQQNMLIESDRFGKGNLCTWLYEDHGADREYLNAPLLHVNPKGYVDSYRIPKYAYYFWQANYSLIPMIHIQPHFWRSQYLGTRQDLVINSNCDTVELLVNGLSAGEKYPGKNNFHSVTFTDIPVQKGTIKATGIRDGKIVSTSITMAGEPAKIVLKSSHERMAAERSAIAIITADIVDQEGNHIYGATNTVAWSVNGPATLVGPEIYESDINKHHSMDGTMYTDMPVSNLIRSDGNPGRIKVTVSASGLSSASIEIDCEELVAGNMLITEPVLKNEGRIKISKNQKLVKEDIFIPPVMKMTNDEFNLERTGRKEYKEFLKSYIFSNNLNLDSATVEFRTLVDLFSTQMVNNSGRMIADDYNFSVAHFNKCMLLDSYIEKTGLPESFRKTLRDNYAKTILFQGMAKDTGEEIALINSIPVDGLLITVTGDKNVVNDRGDLLIQGTGLDEIIEQVNSGYQKLNDDSRIKILNFITEINPNILVTSRSEQSREGDKKKVTNTTYTLVEGGVVWIPYLKFL